MLNIGPDNIGRDYSYFQSTDTDGFYTVKPQKYFGISQEVAGVLPLKVLVSRTCWIKKEEPG